MREIVFDTETTGLDPADGHRVVEIGALELINHVPTGRTYHQYINPGMKMPAEAFAIHGISDAQLADKPRFEAIAGAFLDFIGTEATLVAHNARFDIRFLNHELSRAGVSGLDAHRVVDTLEIVRNRFPGAQNTLDALSRRFGVDTSRRVLHGALLDSELLAEVYLELMGGRQSAFGLEASGRSRDGGDDLQGRAVQGFAPAKARPQPREPIVNEDERAAHAAFVETLGNGGVWDAT